MNTKQHKVIYILSSIGLIFFTTLAHLDHFAIFGDSVIHITRSFWEFPAPRWGDWVAARVVPEFFPRVLLAVFASVIGPIFGVAHISDIYSSFLAFMFALNFYFLALACLKYARAFVSVGNSHFLAVALIFYLLYFGKFGQPNLTLFFAYDVPITLAIWLTFPFVDYLVSGRDPLSNYGRSASTALIVTAIYLVAFSITNVAFFSLVLIELCALLLLLFTPSTSFARRFEILFSAPVWFKLGIVVMPVAVGMAAIFDLASGRFEAEAANIWGHPWVESFSMRDGFQYLKLGLPVVAAVATLISVPIFAWHVYQGKKDGKSPSIRRVSMAVSAVTLALLTYYGFLFALTKFGSRNYFEHVGFSAFFQIFFAIAVISVLFTFTSRKQFSFLQIPLIVILMLGGLRALAFPYKSGGLEEVSQVEVRGVFNSLYMSYCYGSEKVPVFLRFPETRHLVYPNEEHREDWFGVAFSEVFSQYVIRDEHVRFLPEYYAVESVDDLKQDLRDFRDAGNSRCLEVDSSPYFIDLDGP